MEESIEMKFSRKNYDYFVELINNKKITRDEVVQCVKSFEAMERFFKQPNKISTPTINTNGRLGTTVRKKKVTTTTTTTTIVTKKKVTREKKVKQVTETHLFVPIQNKFTIKEVETAMAEKMLIEITRNMPLKKWMHFLPEEMRCQFSDLRQKVSKEDFIKMVVFGEDIRSSSGCSSTSTVGYSSPIVPTKKKKIIDNQFLNIKPPLTNAQTEDTQSEYEQGGNNSLQSDYDEQNKRNGHASNKKKNDEESSNFEFPDWDNISPWSSPSKKRSRSNSLNLRSPPKKRKISLDISSSDVSFANLFDSDNDIDDDDFNYSAFESIDLRNAISDDFDHTNGWPSGIGQ